MSEPVWDGITKAATLTREGVAIRNKLADRARAYDWASVMAILGEQPALINSSRPGGQSRYAVLHQAAHGGAPTDVVEALLAKGAWRTLRNAKGERPTDIAARQGHTHLVALLQPVLRTTIPNAELSAMQQHFHAVILGRVANLVEEHALRLPELEVLQEMAEPKLWFPVPGMYGGFSFHLDALDGQPVLNVTSWIRIAGDSGQLHLVSPYGHLLVADGYF